MAERRSDADAASAGGAVANGGGASIGALMRDLADATAALIRGEAKLARTEVSQAASGAARGIAMVAVGATLALLGLLSLLTGTILLIGDQWLPRDRYWLGALIVVVLSGAIAGWLARRGLARLNPSSLVPAQTMETLREDQEWLNRRMRSGATSS